jgi:hypothetical protein
MSQSSFLVEADAAVVVVVVGWASEDDEDDGGGAEGMKNRVAANRVR